MTSPSSFTSQDAVQEAYVRFEQRIAALRVEQLRLIQQVQHDIDSHRIAQLHEQLDPTSE